MREKRLLQQEVEHLRERLGAAEREVAALRGHPLRGPGRSRAAYEGRLADDRLRLLDHQARPVPPLREARHRAGRRGGLRRFVQPSIGTIAESYNATLDRAAEHDDLEALVLVHQDAEIVDADLCAKVARGAARPRRRRWSAAPGRSTSAASPGGRAR